MWKCGKKEKQTVKQYSFERKQEKKHAVGMMRVTWPLSICLCVLCIHIYENYIKALYKDTI